MLSYPPLIVGDESEKVSIMAIQSIALQQGDWKNIPKLIGLASTSTSLDAAEEKASAALLAVESPQAAKELMDGCAATASALLRMAGIGVPETLLALGLDNLLQGRGWEIIPVGEQQPGDLGSTCWGGERHPGTDHIFTVCKVLNPQEMVVADNQRPFPHQRRTDGKDGKTPTNHFLRAPAPPPSS